MSDINQLVFEAVHQIKRFKPKIQRINIAKQRNRFGGQTAAAMARKRNPGMAAKKAMYRKMYLDIKKREQQMYRSAARSAAMKR